MKSLFVLMLSSCVVLGMAGFRAAAAQPGAPRQAGVNDRGVVQAARFAVNAQQQAMKSAGNTDELSLVKVVSARSQVVAGVNFILTLQVKEGGKLRTADATVWWQAWRKGPYKLTSWKFTDEQGGAGAKPAEGKMESGKPLKLTADAVAADNDFAAELYRQLAKGQQGKNLFFSPYSMLSALAMTAEGARGETAAQMGKALCFPATLHSTGGNAQSLPWNMAALHAGMAALNQRYNPKPAAKEVLDKITALRKDLDDSQRLEKDLQQQNNWDKYVQQNRKSQALAGQLNALLIQVDQYELRVTNALWGEKTYPFSPAYLETIHKFYGTGGAFPADFKGAPEAERQKINTLVQQQTNGRIQDLMPPGSIDDLTRLVLTNAIYFKGQWSKPFDAGDTKDEDFNLAGGQKVSVPMMHNGSLGGARYGAFNADGSPFATPRTIRFDQQPDEKTLYPGKGGFLVAELPYKGGDLAMLAIVPRPGVPGAPIDGLAALEEKLSGANLAAWLAKLESRTIDLQLPKFKLETEYCMNDSLKSLGMVRAFTVPGQAGGAQFDGMCASQDPANKLYIAYVAHKAFVEVNEKGTEAAAATGVAMATAAAPVSMPFVPTFRADRPFLFAIRDVKTGTVLFLGRLSSPKG